MLKGLGESWIPGYKPAFNYQASLVDAVARWLVTHPSWIEGQNRPSPGYDVESFEIDGRSRLIEVKTTNGWERTPFYITRNELAVAESQRSEWCLVRRWNSTLSERPRVSSGTGLLNGLCPLFAIKHF